VDFNETKKSGIVRCSHKAVNKLVSSISTVTKINDAKAGILVKGISGTIKKTGRFFHNNP
jgi:RNase P/RNase MRP subunit POP5